MEIVNLNKIKLLTTVLIIIMIYSIPSYADVFYWDGVEVQRINDDSELLPEGARRSEDSQVDTRASILSSAFADITNDGGGRIALLLETLAHVPCDKIRHDGYLERWEESYQDWNQVADFSFIEYKEDHPDGVLTYLTSVVIVEDQPAGYYYRLCGVHGAWANGKGQAFSTRTNGVMITSKP